MCECPFKIGDLVVIRKEFRRLYIRETWLVTYKVTDTSEYNGHWGVRCIGPPMLWWTSEKHLELASVSMHCFSLDQVES